MTITFITCNDNNLLKWWLAKIRQNQLNAYDQIKQHLFLQIIKKNILEPTAIGSAEDQKYVFVLK